MHRWLTPATLAAIALAGCAAQPATEVASATPPVVKGLRIDGRTAEGPPSEPLVIDDATPRFGWWAESKRRGATQTAYELMLEPTFGGGSAWRSGIVVSSQQVGIGYAGPALVPQAGYRWQVRVRDDAGQWSAWSTPAAFEEGLGISRAWQAAWITGEAHAPSLPLLRKTFSLDKPVTRARLYATARGAYAFHLNGQPVGESRLAPGWTDYRKRIDYQVYDVTAQLRAGDNTLAAMLAPGWYAGSIASFGPGKYGAEPSLIARLRLDFADGSSTWIATDGTWQSHTGPLTAADMIMGEDADARNIPWHWDTPGSSDTHWRAARTLPAPDVSLAVQTDPPVRVTEQRTAKRLDRQPTRGATLFDLGQNMVGVVRVHMHGRPSQRVTLRYGEMLNPDGSLYTANLRSAKATDHYVFGPDGNVTWAPTFTFHGFRYVEISGLDEAPAASDLKGEVWGSDLRVTGELETSSPMLNQLISNIRWGQRGNFVSIPTDTPARDERLGWTGDINVFSPTASTLADSDAFLAKWLRDLRDTQKPDGDFPGVAPDPIGIDGGTGWADASITVPHALWQAYGDTRVIEENYAAMQRFMTRIEAIAGPTLSRTHGNYGDWLHLDDKTPLDLLGTAYLAYDARLMAGMARAIGREDDAREYDALASKTQAAFQQRYLHNGRTSSDSQTSYAMAIGMQLANPNQTAALAERLADRVHARQDHLSTGFLGTPWLLDALVRGGQPALAYKLLMNTDYPSWGYEVTSGATTMWERWNSLKPDGSFGDVVMNSFNHYAYGAVGDWMFRTIGGIAPAAPGYREIALAPLPGGDLTHARMRLASPYGDITSTWTRHDKHMEGRFDVPFNTTAVVTLPVANVDDVRINGKALREAPGVSAVSADASGVHFRMGSGEWQYVANLRTEH
ncbi:glycoside hydrolase family 78 protein [Luteibacter aegosomaticola]|uniref:glycoside hydrolase family 78 protein n=1 Tax=Luteibacter aegosomaticola TaxID=2911538 RepID=UPI001FF7C88C|nr:glycoside hydrolase family 78 protein [Luteibacter aegosomaticola]UPG91510.1 glycoside hydrolase family 78 protein [Luteibacter aegosomaticola]